MPDYDEIAKRLNTVAPKYGVDPSDIGKLTQVGMKFAKKYNSESFDPIELNNALHRLRGFNAQTGQEVKPEETWSQTIGESAAQGLRNALTVGNAVMATPELIASKLGVYDLPTAGGNDWSPASNFFKRVDETRALEEARAARERGLGQQLTGAVVEPLANPLTYVGGGAGPGALMATQAGVQGVDRIRAGAIAGEENLAAKGAAAALIGGLGARSYGGVGRDIGANVALGGGQEVGESFIDNREIDPMTLALSGAGQVGASALGIGANVIADANVRADRTAQVNQRIADDALLTRQAEIEASAQPVEPINYERDILRQQLAAERSAKEIAYERDVAAARREQLVDVAKNDPQKFNQWYDSLDPSAKAKADEILRGVDLTGQTERVGDVPTPEQVAIRESLDPNKQVVEPLNQGVARDIARQNETQAIVDDAERATHEKAVSEIGPIKYGETSDQYMARLQAKRDEIASRSAMGGINVPKPLTKAPKPPKASEVVGASELTAQPETAITEKNIANARAGGINIPTPLSKAPKPPKASEVVSASEMTTSPEVMPSDKTTNPTPGSEGSSPTTAKVGPLVPERSVGTTPIVESQPQAQTPQAEPVVAKPEPVVPEAPKAVEPSPKAKETTTTAKPEGKTNEEVRQEASPQQAAQEGEVLTEPVYKVYKDPVTGNNKATSGEIPEGAKVITRTEKNADRYDAIVERTKAAEKRDPWNKARAGVTLSDVADVGRAIKSFLGLDSDTQSASDVRGLRKTAAHASSMEIDRIVRENETDPTNSVANKEVEKRAKTLANYSRRGVYGKSWFAAIAEARGGDYRTVTRKIFNRELAADHIRWLNETAEGKKAEQGARQYFIDNGMTPDEARIVVDKIKQQHESPYMPSAVSDKGISKIRNNKMDPRLDKFFGKIENPKDQLAMTLSLQERAINQIKHNENVIAEGTAKGWLKDAKSAPSGYKVIEINGANYYVKPELQHIVELEVNGPESLVSSVLRSVDSTGRVLVTAGSGVQFVARTLMGNAWTAANTGMFVNPKRVAQAFKTAATKLELIKRKSDEHLNLVRDGVILETGAGTYGMQREALAGGKPSIGDKSNKIANWLFKPSTTVDNTFRLATYELRKDVLRDLNPDITPDELHAKAAEYVRNALPTPQNALPAVQKMRKIPLIPTFLTYPTEAAIRNPLNILKYSVDDMKAAIETKNAAKIASASSRLALAIASMGAAAGAVEALSGKDLSEEKKKSIRQLGGFSQNDSLYFLPDGKNAISLSSINPFDLTIKNLNALRDKAGLMAEPDGLALYGENVRNTLVSSFVGSPGLSAIGVALNPAQNQSRFEAPLQLVPAPVRKAISNNDIAELRPLVTAENALRTVVPKEEADVKKKLGFEAKLAKLNRNYEFGKFFKNGSDMVAAEKAVKEMADDYDGIVRAVRNAREVGGYDDVKLHSMLATAIPRFEDREAIIRGERPYVDTPEQFMLKLKVAELRRRAQLYVQLKQDPELAEKYRDQIPDSARAYKLMSKIGKYISKARDEGASPELIKRLDSLLEEQLKAQPQ